jgi:hypothetical protein
MLNLNLLNELRNRAVRKARIMHDYIQVEFLDGTVLNLNNDVELDGWSVPYTDEAQLPLHSLAGCTVLEVSLTADCLKLKLSGDHFLTMTLKPDAWRSPEALALFVPGEPPVVFTEPLE